MQCVVTGGVVLNPASILGEIDGLLARGVPVGKNLVISDRAHVIFPWHIAEDRALDKSCSSGEDIGTTHARHRPLLSRQGRPLVRHAAGRSVSRRFSAADRAYRGGQEPLAGQPERQRRFELRSIRPRSSTEYQAYAERLRPYVADTTAYLLDAVEAGKRILFEGAQGALLDIDHGTFPFVTSSNSSGVGVSSGSGVPGRWITKVIGVIKAYSTRVGGGPFPTEQNNEIGQHIRDRGNEYGTVTRRPRRCGWFDAVAARYTARLSGVDTLAVMLLDVLDEMPEIKICTAYEIDGRRVTDFPSHVDDLRRAVPVYETLPGWRQDMTGVRRMEDLPAAAHAYLDRLSKLVGRPVEVVSVGPDREQTIFADGRRRVAAAGRSSVPSDVHP